MRLTRPLIFILILAVAVRLFLFLVLEQKNDPSVFMLGDTSGYLRIANNLIAGNGFSQATTSPFVPDGMRTPGFPFILAAVETVFGNITAYVLIQVVMSAIVILLSYKIARLVTESDRVAHVVAALAAFEPYSVFITMTILTETVFTLLLLMAVYFVCLYAKERLLIQLATASALFGICTLVRPITEFIPILLILFVIYMRMDIRRSMTAILTILFCFAAAVSPWIIRNIATFNTPMLTSGGFQNVYSDLGSTVMAYDQGSTFKTVKQQLEEEYVRKHSMKSEDLQGDPSHSGDLFRNGVGIFFSHPKAAIQSIFTVCIAFFTNDAWAFYIQRWGWMPHYEFGFSPTYTLLTQGPIVTMQRVIAVTGPTLIVPLVGRVFWLIISVAFFGGSFILYRRSGYARSIAVFFTAIVMYLVVLTLSAGAGTNGRYRYPINIILYTGAVVAISHTYNQIRKKISERSIL